MKRYRKIKSILVLPFVVYNIMGVHQIFAEEVTINASLKAPFTTDESGLISIEVKGLDDTEIVKIIADASSLGEPKLLNISPELDKITVTAADFIEPGNYPIPITLTDTIGNQYKTSVDAEIIESSHQKQYAWDEEIIYFMLTDRFYNGDGTNDNPFNLPYDQSDNPGGVYHGGDFKGITEKLDYLSELGITTVWITPIVQNIEQNVEGGSTGDYYAYHGYWASDFEKLNPHLGSLADFHHLIDKAAEKNISIMVDVVLNHAGYGMDGNGKNETEFSPTKENIEKFEGLLRTEKNRKPGDQVLDGLSGLPDFATEDPIVRQQLVDWQTNWINISTTEKGNRVKAYRVDTVKHVENTTWQHFKNEIVEIAPDFHLIGEVWDAQFNRVNAQLGDGMMDSLLDFGFKNHAAGFANGYFETHQKILEERNKALTSTRTMGQFLSSHDEDGFLLTMVNNDLGRYKVAVTLQMTSKGQPIIYYGEEIGLSGANNWPIYDNRYDFDWNKVANNDLLTHYKKLIAFRKQYLPLITDGDLEYVAGGKEQEWFITKRFNENDAVYIVYNVKDSAQEIEFEVANETVSLVDEYQSIEYLPEKNEEGKWMIKYSVPARNEGGTGLLHLSSGHLNVLK